MFLRLLAVLGALCPLPVLANGAKCGGDALSSAQVVENRPARSGPLTAVPDTLCADLSDTKRSRLRIDVYSGPYGGTGSEAPYDGSEPGGSRPRRGDRSR
ncbi:hypothetical protein [Methylobacterium oryzisoli]|uniref:hypothetical protein n=1 Tax=Methylobacterium oryzisoli TaxID=3385502 RepID=UPI00389273BB